jgi:hypothetical protein
MARARTTGGASVEVDGLMETLKAFQGLERELRKEANSELRQAARTCAAVLAGHLARAASSSPTRVARRVARSIRVKSDRVPVVSIGGPLKVGATGAQAGALVWGSEHGPAGDVNRFGVPASSAGYWIGPTVAAFQRDEAVTIFKRAVYSIQRRYGLV